MTAIKALAFVAVCLATQLVMVSSDCASKILQGAPNYDVESFKGGWYTGLVPVDLLKAYMHWYVRFIYVPGGKSTINGTTEKVNSDGKRTPMNVQGEWLLFGKQNPTFGVDYQTQGANSYDSNYTCIALSEMCFMIVQGCPEGFSDPLTAVLFREVPPTDDCYKEGLDALEQRQITNLVPEDNMPKTET